MRISIVAVSMLGGALICSACIRHYEPPRPDQPHAVVKVRRTYDRHSGPFLREKLDIGEYRALERAGIPLEAPITDPILVHPGPARWSFAAAFFHPETRMVMETYYVQESYSATESYSCGTSKSPQSCTRSVTRYRSVPRTRWVPRTVEVVDGACQMPVAHQVEVNHVYLLQFHYLDNSVCQVECYEQLKAADGSDENRRCAPPSP